MTAILFSKTAPPPLEIAQYIRNNEPVGADIQNKLATLTDYVAYVRAKQIFTGSSPLGSIPNSLATRNRWRFAWHSGPYASFLYVRFVIAPQNNGTATDPYCTLTVRDATGTQTGTATVHGGSSGGTYADVPVNFTGGVTHLVDGSGAFVFLDTDTEYTGVFQDIGYARLQAALVWEVSLAPDTDNDYVANNLGTGGPIFDAHRNDVLAMQRTLHRRSGMPVFNWFSDVDS